MLVPLSLVNNLPLNPSHNIKECVIGGNVGYGFLVAKLLRRKGIQLGVGAEIRSHAYLFGTTIEGTKKKETKKEASIAEQSINFNAHLTLIKRKRVNKHAMTTVASNESSVDREPLI